MTDKTIEIVNMGKVYVEKDGSLYFIKETQTFKFLLVNQNGENVFTRDPIKTEQTHVTPESLGYSKDETWDIYVYKVNHSELEDTTEYYEMPLFFKVPAEARYKTCYLKRVQSGRVFVVWFDSGCTSEISINDPEWTTRGKATKLAPDTILKRDAPIFSLSSSGELERRLDSEAVW